jgi:hypothetical protein
VSVDPERCLGRRGRENCEVEEFWYTDMLGCSISRFSRGDVSMWIGPSEVKQGGGVRNHDSSNDKEGRDDEEEALVKER